MIFPTRFVACALALVCFTRLAAAEKDIVIETPGERTMATRMMLGGLLAVGAVAGGLGVYWHLDSRSASSDVSASRPTGRSWTAEDTDLVDRADRSRTRAAIAYGIGGAFLIGTVVAFIVTEPPTETTVITPHRAFPTLSPSEGGAILGGTWSF